METNPLARLAREAKHATFVIAKCGRHLLTEAENARRIRPGRYSFDPERYPSHRFLWQTLPDLSPGIAPRRLFVIWTGENQIPEVRARNLVELQKKAGVEIELVTPASLDKWILPDHPLHPAYNHLSLTHKSDYLRAYLLHHHGGGYCDVKTTAGDWGDAFDEMSTQNAPWLCGYREDSRGRLPRLGGNLEKDLRRHFDLLVGTGAMIAQPRTPLTGEWFNEVERRMSYFYSLLEQRPGGVRDEVAGYPVGWTQLLADILYPLALKHHREISAYPALQPLIHDYR